MVTLLATVLVLGILVFVHELGHFLAAKRSGIRVDQFSLGFPPKMVGKKVGETEYVLSWLPIGGYVKMAGQNDFKHEPGTGDPREFFSKSVPVRIFVIAAGPVMNWAFAFLLFWFILAVAGKQTLTDMRVGDASRLPACAAAGIAPGDSIVAVNGKPVESWDRLYRALDPDAGVQRFRFMAGPAGTPVDVDVALPADSVAARLEPFIAPQVGEVVPGGPAERAGVRPGDIVTRLDSVAVPRWQDLVRYVRVRPEAPMTVAWTRNGEPMEAHLTTGSRRDGTDSAATGVIGIGVAAGREKIGFFRAAGTAAAQTASWTGQIFGFIGDLVTGRTSVKNLGGPIRIAQMAGQSARYGWISLLGFMAILSVNLAVINVLPLPMFDGGHIIMYMAEAVTGKPLSDRSRAVVQYMGLALIITLTVFVLVNDLLGL